MGSRSVVHFSVTTLAKQKEKLETIQANVVKTGLQFSEDLRFPHLIIGNTALKKWSSAGVLEIFKNTYTKK